MTTPIRQNGLVPVQQGLGGQHGLLVPFRQQGLGGGGLIQTGLGGTPLSLSSTQVATALIVDQLRGQSITRQRDSGEVTAQSRQMIASAIARDGVLSTGKLVEMQRKVDDEIDQFSMTVRESREAMRATIKSFDVHLNELQNQVMGYTRQFYVQLSQGNGKEDEATLALKLATSVLGYLSSSAQEALLIHEKALALGHNNVAKSLVFIQEARSKELELFGQAMEIVMKKEEHDFKIDEATVAQGLKAQQQLFGQLKDMLELNEKAMEAERKNELEILTEQNGHVVKMRVEDVKAQKNRLDKEASDFAARLDADVKNHKAELDARVAVQRAESDASVRMHEASAQRDAAVVREQEQTKRSKSSCAMM